MVKMGEEQLKKIFQQIARRIEKRKDSLTTIKKLEKNSTTKGMGIEGWLKVETAKALGDKIKKIQNRGPDIILEDNGTIFEIELKGMSNFSITENSLNKNPQADIYLYLCGCDTNKWKELLKFKTWKLVDKRIFNDGVGEWILFMVKHE